MAASPKLAARGVDSSRRDADSALLRLIDDEVSNGITFENDDLVGDKAIRSRKGERDAALDYYDGVMDDLPSEQGRSSAVSRDVADVTDTMLPGLMRVFAGADKVAIYAPNKPGDEEIASQATDYINYVWTNEINGYQITHTWIKDALDVRNGIVKAYWDQTPEYESEDLRGLVEDQIVALLEDPEVELIGADGRDQIIRDPASGQMIPLTVYDVRINRATTNGKLVVENVPPDDFGISKGASSIETARAVWHRSRVSRSDLVKQGYPRDVVEDLPAYGSRKSRGDADRYEDDDTRSSLASETGATAEVEVIEAYVRFDYDDDGIAEMRKVVVAGSSGGREPLSNEPWTEEVPFVSMTGQPVPHRWMGRSTFDNVGDLQRVKTALLRGVLDNIYSQNRPQRCVVDEAIINPDEVLNPTYGGVIRIKRGHTAQGAIQDLVAPNISGNILAGIQYIDSVIQRRTGVSTATASLDSTALEPQTATAASLEHDASYARVELIARNMAEMGFKPLFSKLLRIIVRNQDRPRTVRLRDEWVAFDPVGWNAAMDVSINVGLGTGSRERDLTMLSGIRARQNAIIEQLGLENPVVTPSMVVAAEHKMVEAAGVKDPEQFFRPITAEEFSQWQASKPPAPPDPKLQAIQAKAQMDQQTLQARAQGDQQRIQADVAMDQAKQAAELQMARERLEQEHALKVEQMNRDFELRRAEMENEAQLRAVSMATGVQGVSTNIPRQ
ncbi:portal protein [Methylobacterium sp. Leaf85]|uniref:portal protein n=1 Tax=Methylobacterium sp. Leaf85 TaxID=1736241 RepID=UPI0006FE8A16|nr:hypothetical protein [Methylobacterium sp. Leaf85]KQO43020.1 hypothetical protein ASF08_10605 [Methylobacterium sp. Leaf85]